MFARAADILVRIDLVEELVSCSRPERCRLGPLAIVGWRQCLRERRPWWLLLLPVLYFIVVMALFLALGRYPVPVLVALMVMAMFGVDTLMSRGSERGA